MGAGSDQEAVNPYDVHGVFGTEDDAYQFLDWYADQYGVVTSHLELYCVDIELEGFGRTHRGDSERLEAPPEQGDFDAFQPGGEEGNSGWMSTTSRRTNLGVPSAHLVGLSLSNTKTYLERLGVDRSRTAIHNWVQKADLQPTSGADPNHIAVDETVIQLNNERRWLYTAVDPETNEILHIRLFPTRTTQLTVLFLRELSEKHHLDEVPILVDAAHHLKAALSRLGLRFQVRHHGNRNAIERVFREVKRRTSSFAHTFSHVQPATAERWLQAFAVWWTHA